MKNAVRYYSRSGNTKKLAEAIAKAVGATASTTDTPIGEPVDTLFLGGALYAGKIDKHLRTFVENLTPDKVRRIAVFSTAASPQTIQPEVIALLKDKGIEVISEVFSSKGKFLLAHRGHPDEQDCAAAATFAKKIIKK